jgi:Peptidase family M23
VSGPFGAGPTVSGMFTHAHISRRLGRVATLAALLAAASALLFETDARTKSVSLTEGSTVRTTVAAAGATHDTANSRRETSGAYGWPVKPFFSQHPVRGFFGDPRIGLTAGTMTHSFHFGIDISAPNGTPVYATLTGRVVREPSHPETVSVVAQDGRRYEYWHLVPAIRNGASAIAYRTVVGYIASPWAHVHFSERRGGRYVNPLRPGALAPYRDGTSPTVKSFVAQRGDDVVRLRATSGTVDLVAEAADETPVAVRAPWNDKPVTPALVRWRMLDAAGAAVLTWRTAVDVRLTIPSDDSYTSVYAVWTRQNSGYGRRGRYRFYLTHGLDTSRLPDGAYVVEVAAADTAGNTARQRFPVKVDNS